MAYVIPFKSLSGKRRGLVIACLPMPDGSHRHYMAENSGKNATAAILGRWRKDKKELKNV